MDAISLYFNYLQAFLKYFLNNDNITDIEIENIQDFVSTSSY